jgi:hypothetical protein
MKVWALLGWRAVRVSVAYAAQPAVVAVEPDPEKAGEREPAKRLPVFDDWRRSSGSTADQKPAVHFSGESHQFAVPVFAEVYVGRLLDRDEFRRHCDRHGSEEAILDNLP